MSFESRSIPLLEIAAGAGISPATASRIMTELKDSGYAGQLANKEYFLTYKLYMVAGRAVGRNRFVEDMLPYLNYFTMKYDCGMSLTTFLGGSCVNIISVSKNIRFRAPLVVPGTAHPCHCTASGKLFLSCLTDDELNDWFSKNPLLPYTEKTIIDAQLLREQLCQTRENGFAVVVGEYDENTAALAIPAQYSRGRVVSTLNFAAGIPKFDEINNPDFIAAVKETLAENNHKEWYNFD